MSFIKKEEVRNSVKMLRNYMEIKWLQRRPELVQYGRLMKELKKEDVKRFRIFLRMDYELYHEILQRIDGDSKFTWVEVGSHGSAGDAQV